MSGTVEVGSPRPSPVSCSCHWHSCAAGQEPRAPSVRPAPRPRSSCPSCWLRHRRRGSGCAAWPGGRRHSRAQSRHPLVTVAERHRRGEACRVRDSWACHHPPAPARKGGVVPTRRPHAELDGAAFGRLPSGGRGDGRGRSRGCRDRRACRFEHGFSSRQAHARRAGAACSEGAPAAHTEFPGAALPKPPAHARPAAGEARGNSATRHEAAPPASARASSRNASAPQVDRAPVVHEPPAAHVGGGSQNPATPTPAAPPTPTEAEGSPQGAAAAGGAPDAAAAASTPAQPADPPAHGKGTP